MQRVDQIDNLQMSRKEAAKELCRPTLKRLGHQCMICEGERVACGVPGLVPANFELIYEEPHQFCHGNRRMRIIELDCGVLIEGSDGTELLQVSTHNVSQGRRGKKVLLAEPELLS